MSIIFTPKAINKTVAIISRQEPEEKTKILGVRIAIQGGGCAGYNYIMNFEKEGGDSRFGKDKIFEFDGKTPEGDDYKLKIFVDPVSILYIDGTTVDFIDSLEESGFKFKNPNADKTCGCGKSFSA